MLTPAAPEVDVAALRAEAVATRARQREMVEDRAAGLITREQLLSGTATCSRRLEEIESELQGAVSDSPIAPLIGKGDIRAEWNNLPLTQQKAIVDSLMVVRILASGQRGSRFFPETVEITFRG